MITNPQIGKKVKWIGGSYPRSIYDHPFGIIRYLRPSSSEYPVVVDFEREASYPCYLSELEYVDISPEEQAAIDDQQRRQEHANKYL